MILAPGLFSIDWLTSTTFPIVAGAIDVGHIFDMPYKTKDLNISRMLEFYSCYWTGPDIIMKVSESILVEFNE